MSYRAERLENDHKVVMEHARNSYGDALTSRLITDAIAHHLAMEGSQGRYPEPPLPNAVLYWTSTAVAISCCAPRSDLSLCTA